MTTGSLPKPDNRLYLGRGGSGKTTLALAHTWAFPRVIVSDPTGQDALAEGCLVTDDKLELISFLRIRGDLRICWRGAFVHGQDEAFDFVNRAALAAGDICMLWDEAHLSMTPQRLPPSAFEIWNAGRHQRCRVFASAMRPARVSRDCTANLSRACVFQTLEPSDLRFLRSFMEPSAALEAAKLPQYHAIDWTPEAWSVKKSVFP